MPRIRDKEKQKEYARQHYLKNKEVMKERAKIRSNEHKAKMRLFIWDVKSKSCCRVCGEDDPIVLEFDHINPPDKKFNIGDAVRLGYSLNNIIAEIDKCQILCANCHRRKTHMTRDSVTVT